MRYIQTERDLSQLEEEYRKRRTVRTASPLPVVVDSRLTTETQEAVLALFQVISCEPPQLADMCTNEQLPVVLRRVRGNLETYVAKYRSALEALAEREGKVKDAEVELRHREEAVAGREREQTLTEKTRGDNEKQVVALKETLQEQQAKLQDDTGRFKRAVKAFESAQHDSTEKEQILSQKYEWISREEQRLRSEASDLTEQRQQLEDLRGEIAQDQHRVMEDKEKVGKQLAEIDVKARQLKQGIETFIKERQDQTLMYKKRKTGLKEAMGKLRVKEEQIKQREAETSDLMKDIQKEHERLLKDTEERSHFFKAMEESLAAKELELTEERQELEELTKDLAGIKRDLEAQQDELVHQLNARQSNIEHQEHMLDIRSKELESQSKSLEDELAVVQEIKLEVEKTQKELDESRRNWMNKVAVKESEISGMKAELESGKKRLEEEEKRVNESRAAHLLESKKIDRAETTEIAEMRAQIAKIKVILTEKEEMIESLRAQEVRLKSDCAQKESEISRREGILKQKDEELAACLSEVQTKERKIAAQVLELQRQELKIADNSAQYANLMQAKSDFERYKAEISQEIENELSLVRREKEELESTALVLEKVHEDLNRARIKNERDAQVIAADFQRIQELLAQLPSPLADGWKRLESIRYQDELAEQKLMEMDRFEDKIRVEEGDSMGSLSLLSLSTPRGSRESSL